MRSGRRRRVADDMALRPVESLEHPEENRRADRSYPRLGSRLKWKREMAIVAATFRDSTSRLSGMVNRSAAVLLVAIERPRPSFPTAGSSFRGESPISSIGIVPQRDTSAAEILQPR